MSSQIELEHENFLAKYAEAKEFEAIRLTQDRCAIFGKPK